MFVEEKRVPDFTPLRDRIILVCQINPVTGIYNISSNIIPFSFVWHIGQNIYHDYQKDSFCQNSQVQSSPFQDLPPRDIS